MNGDCIFCRIVKGEIPATRVFEDDGVLAFMDIGPIVKGHVLVIPKAHCDPLTAAPPDVLQRLILVVQKIAAALVEGLAADGINVTQANGRVAGQVVPHLHFHVIPRFANDGHHWNWNAKSYESPAETEAFAARIRKALAV